MKIFALAFLLFSTLALGAAQTSVVPTTQTEFQVNKWMGPVALANKLGTVIRQAHNTAVGVYDYSLTGGNTGTHNVGILLPDNAIVQDILFDVITAPVGSGSSEIAFSAETTGDLKAALVEGSWTGKLDGVPVGSAATAIKLTSAKQIKAEVTVASLTAGKIKVFLEYVVSE